MFFESTSFITIALLLNGCNREIGSRNISITKFCLYLCLSPHNHLYHCHYHHQHHYHHHLFKPLVHFRAKETSHFVQLFLLCKEWSRRIFQLSVHLNTAPFSLPMNKYIYVVFSKFHLSCAYLNTGFHFAIIIFILLSILLPTIHTHAIILALLL